MRMVEHDAKAEHRAHHRAAHGPAAQRLRHVAMEAHRPRRRRGSSRRRRSCPCSSRGSMLILEPYRVPHATRRQQVDAWRAAGSRRGAPIECRKGRWDRRSRSSPSASCAPRSRRCATHRVSRLQGEGVFSQRFQVPGELSKIQGTGSIVIQLKRMQHQALSMATILERIYKLTVDATAAERSLSQHREPSDATRQAVPKARRRRSSVRLRRRRSPSSRGAAVRAFQRVDRCDGRDAQGLAETRPLRSVVCKSGTTP